MTKSILQKINLIDGKYTYIRDSFGHQEVLRYEESWRSITGDKFIAAMADRIFDLQANMQELVAAATEVLRISDRDHNAWHKANAAIGKLTEFNLT